MPPGPRPLAHRVQARSTPPPSGLCMFSSLCPSAAAHTSTWLPPTLSRSRLTCHLSRPLQLERALFHPGTLWLPSWLPFSGALFTI